MKNNKKLIITLTIVGVLLVSLGTTYALLIGWSSRISKNSSLVVGDIYMHYNEGNKQISITDAMPSDTYSNDYFEFTIDGKNTSNKNINYLISLSYGDIPSNRTIRIKDSLLDFKLVEVVNNQENVLVDTINFNSLTNARLYMATIPSNTNNYLKTYRLYMKINNNTVIGDVNQDYTIDEWNNVFASIKVNSLGTTNVIVKDIATFKEMVLTEKSNTYIEEDNTIYLSGSKADVNFNYVWYSGKMWRITAINPDGTMKMITDDAITTISYNPEGDVNFYDISKKDDASYTGSWMYQWLNEDFLDTLYNYQNIIVEDSTWNITTSSSNSTKLPETTLINNSTIGKNTPVGLLNSYEYYLSYKNTSYRIGYLNIGYYWWLLNPYSSSYVWYVSLSGDAYDDSSLNAYGARPSINLKSNIQLSGGSGTKDDPYTISGDKEQPTINTTLLNTRAIGEYVVFDEDGDSSTKELYRIVGIEDEKTKLNKNDYIRNKGTVEKKLFSKSSSYGRGDSDEYWDYYLSNTWYNSLVSINMLDSGIYYINGVMEKSYKNSVCSTNNTIETTKNCIKNKIMIQELYVGLPRYGEMFASQQGNGHKNSYDMWLITPDAESYTESSNVNGVAYSGIAKSFASASLMICARPSIYLKSNIVITGGSGTKSNPFTIALKD